MPAFFFLFPFLCMDSEDWTQVHTLVMLLLSSHVLYLSTEICSLAYNTVSIPIIWLWEGNNGIQSIKKCGLKWRDRSFRNESKAFIYNAKTLWGPKGQRKVRWELQLGESCLGHWLERMKRALPCYHAPGESQTLSRWMQKSSSLLPW